MIPIKQYIAEQFVKNTYHFTCNCLIPLDVIGTVQDYSINDNEIILLVSVKNKIIRIGLNTPSLYIEQV